MKQVHQFKNNGYNIVLDVCSGSVHVVDDLVYDLIALYEEQPEEEVIRILGGRYPAEGPEDIREAYAAVRTLTEEGKLFTDDRYQEAVIDFKKRKTVEKAL